MTTQQYSELEKEYRTIIGNIRSAPSPYFDLEQLSQIGCPCCGLSKYAVRRYPAHKSKTFAGQILLQCKVCSVAFVPNTELDLKSYYENEYAAEFMKRRLHDGEFWSQSNPFWQQGKRLPVQDRATFHSTLLRTVVGNAHTLLDFGPGEGFFLNEVDAEFKYALELDPNCQTILKNELGVELVDRVSSVSNFYDVVTSLRSLEHLPYNQVRTVVTEIHSALKPGGRFLVDVPNGAMQMVKFGLGSLSPFAQLEPHTMFFSGYSLRVLLEQCGFRIEWSTSVYDPDSSELFSRDEIGGGETLVLMGIK